MPAIRSLIIGFMAFMLTGCGQLISEKLAVSDSSRVLTCTGKKLAILPLADYTYSEDADRAYSRNLAIMENLTSRLSENGFRMPIQDDLLKYLEDNGIVKVNHYTASAAQPGYLQNLLSNDSSWSPEMKKELTQLAYPAGNDTRNQHLALDQATLAKIAANFKADFIVRGQITQLEMGEENTWNPMKRGFFPVVFSGTNRALFGVTNSETYDDLGSMLTGAVIAGSIGSQTNFPYDHSEKLNPGHFNGMAWSMGGAALGYMSSKGGHANQAAVQLRLWAQDPTSGEVVWTNSVKVLVKPQTVFAETREDKLFDTAIEQAVSALVKNFVSNTKALM